MKILLIITGVNKFPSVHACAHIMNKSWLQSTCTLTYRAKLFGFNVLPQLTSMTYGLLCFVRRWLTCLGMCRQTNFAFSLSCFKHLLICSCHSFCLDILSLCCCSSWIWCHCFLVVSSRGGMKKQCQMAWPMGLLHMHKKVLAQDLDSGTQMQPKRANSEHLCHIRR